MEKIVEFKAIPKRCVYNSTEFKVYGCIVDSFKYPDIFINKYGTCTIKGNILELNLDIEYNIKAKEIQDKYDTGYSIINIKREKPKTLEASRNYLLEIITQKQTDTLLAIYPDIVNKVVNNDLDDIDLTELQGIGKTTFEKIKSKIIENFELSELIEEYNGLFSMNVIKKLYNEYTSIDKIRESIKNDPYNALCSLGGIGFKTADNLILKLSRDKKSRNIFDFDLESSYQRALACVIYLLSGNESNGNTYMDLKDLKQQFDVLVPQAKIQLIEVLKSDDVYFNKDLLRIAKKSTYNIEEYIGIKIKEALQTKNKWDFDCSEFGVVDGSSLTDDQKKTVELLCNNDIVILSGYSGTGKSFSTLSVINMLHKYKKTFEIFAPTGKASKVISGYTHERASTIHRGLGFMPPNIWTYNVDKPLSVDVVIVDEVSMVDIFIFKRLLEAIDFNKTKLLLIGDPAQIPSVGAGNILYDLLQAKIVPTVNLTKVFRYGCGGLSTVATDIRNSKVFLDKCKNNNIVETFGEDKSYTFIQVEQEKIIGRFTQLYKKLIAKGYMPSDIAVLSCYNVGDYGVNALNKTIQGIVNNDESNKIIYGDTEFRIGDIVLNYVNNYKAIKYNDGDIDEDKTTFVANGESGRIDKIEKDGIVVEYDNEKIFVPKSNLGNMKLGYAYSTHKSQGSQTKVVIFISPSSHTYMLNSNLMYVGITRAKEKCFHLGEKRTVNIALKKKENFNRKTMLCNLLML